MRVIQGATHKLGRKRAKQALAGLSIALLLFNVPFSAFADTPDTSSPAPVDQSATTTPAPAPDPSTSTPAPSPAPTTDPAPVLSLVDPLASGTLHSTAGSNSTAASTTTVQNNIDSTATSGDATVSGNKKAGDATSGDASANANVLNIAGSTTNIGNTTVFTQNIGTTGQNVDHDIIINPADLQGAQGGNATSSNLQTNTSLTDLLNNISLSAQSGDATVSGNKKAGDATSGDATALANIMNIVGSTVNAQNSFLGIINIYGNLKGDILVPKSFVDSLVENGGSLTNGNANTVIDNNITANATSGDATVSGNKKAGDATSGDATSSVTVFNLTGQQVVAKNSLLVFVNVLGKWVGMIVPAPGSNSAVLGGGVEQAGQASGGQDGDTTTHITNNISVNAQSGDATVSGNKKAGDATSGNAAAGVSLVNITNSDFQLGDWFGALFINVLGSWIGDFGIHDDTPATTGGDTEGQQQPIQDVKIFRFDSEAPVTPVNDSEEGQYTSSDNSFNVALTSSTDDGTPSGHVLGTSTSTNAQDASSATHSISVDLVALIAIIGSLTLLIALGSLALRRRFNPNATPTNPSI